jgi:hypothetical protein
VVLSNINIITCLPSQCKNNSLGSVSFLIQLVSFVVSGIGDIQ